MSGLSHMRDFFSPQILPNLPLRMQVSVSTELFGDVFQEENNNFVGKSRAMAVEKYLLTNFYNIVHLRKMCDNHNEIFFIIIDKTVNLYIYIFFISVTFPCFYKLLNGNNRS